MLTVELSIIVVNYKTPQLTLKCVESIKTTVKNIKYEIIIVDNCSNDNSEKLITEKHKDIIWIANSRNDGFGRANNKGIAVAKGEYILLINSDIVVLENTIDKCFEYIKKDKSIGVLGCKLLNEDGSLQKSIYYYIGDYIGVMKDNLLYEYFFRPSPKEIKAVMGAFMLIARKVFMESQGFDPDFFMYAEELELCHRIKQLGYKINYYDKAIATHKHGGSSDGATWSGKQNYLSNALLYLKTKGLGGYFIYHILYNFTFFTNLLLLWKMDSNYRKAFYIDSGNYFSNLTQYIKIPFLYGRTRGNGKRMLYRNKKL